MADEYVDCESEIKLSLCMNADCMCKALYDKITKPKWAECAVYVFTEEGLMKYGFGKIRNLGEEEAGKITII